MGIDDRTDLSKQILPANKTNMPFQLPNLFLTLLWQPPTGIPKYLNGVFITSQLRIVAKQKLDVFSTPTPPILLFKKFSLRPEANSKQFRITLMLKTLLRLALQKNKVSSTYCSIFTLTFLLLISTLSTKSFSTAILETPASPSTTIRKRNGANGSPCLRPLFGINSLVMLPLTRIHIEAYSRQDVIQEIHFAHNPSLPSI